MLLTRFRPIRAAVAATVATLSLGTANATEILYFNLGNSETPSLNTDGVVVTASNSIKVLSGSGLGVVGGNSNNVVDGAEYIDFSFAGLGGAVNVAYFVGIAGNLNGDNVVGSRTLSIYGVGGSHLGTFGHSSVGTFNVSTLVANTPIGSIRLQADVDFFVVRSISFTTQPEPVPAPATAALLLAGLGAGALLRRRRTDATA